MRTVCDDSDIRITAAQKDGHVGVMISYFAEPDDAENKEFWFTTYGASQPYQPKEVLYCVSHDFKEIKRKYHFSTAYGLDCLGKDGVYACYQFQRNGRRGGVAYRCDESWFEVPKNDATLKELIYGDIEK